MSSAQQFETKAELGCGFFSFSSLLRVVMASIGAARDGPFIDLSEMSHTTQRLNHWLKVISKWRDYL